MKRVLAFLLIAMFFSVPCFGAPSISSTSGTFSHDSIVTITGTNFGTKSPAAPWIWADFEDGSINPSSLGQNGSWSVNTNLILETANQLSHSNYSVSGTWDDSTAKRSFSFRSDKTYWTKIYHYQKRYYDFDATNNQKFWRLWPTAGPHNFLGAYIGTDTARCYNEDEGYSGGVIGSYQGASYTKDQWLTEEFKWQFEGGNGKNTDDSIRWVDPEDHDQGFYSGIWDHRRNGVEEQHRENINNVTSTLVQLRTDNYTNSANIPADGSKVYMDNIYIDDTYARVMIGDQSTFDASTQLEIQIPSAWSATSITITVNQGTYLNSDNAYLFVWDENNGTSTGFAMSFAGGGAISFSGANMILGSGIQWGN